ncbi:ATP-binding protein [Adlercreutzia sp. ZJ304]|uniref:ATP-binding protein n=1 Tax=Adlercreutzia sp. ZJ304 TaxID=2709791 RepID=UPI0013EB8C98|nr:ATP-binding protein [Adlercreutzia sp. ZJ304]
MYIAREIEKTIDRMLTQGKVVLVTGARQVGKTTVLKEHLGDRFDYVTMDDPFLRMQAEEDAALFFDMRSMPLIIDEVQRVPGLFLSVKLIVDRSDQKGLIVLTGSQTYQLMNGVSESLAGRIRILEMPALSLRELVGCVDAPHRYLPKKVCTGDIDAPDAFDLWTHIHRGSMPELQDPSIEWDGFWTDYVRSYLERDVRELINVKDETKFYSFMAACAARTAQLFNASDIANALDIDHKTAKAWLSVLQASGIVCVIEPFFPNVDKWLTKTPKIFFIDTGLVCHLTRWTTPDQLRNGAVAGHVFETFVVSEVLKSHMNAGANMRDVWFYRDAKKREIDLVIQDGRVLHPVEIKMGALVKKDAAKNFSCLEGMADYEIGFGHIVCQAQEPYLLTPNVEAVPVWAI